VAYTTIQQSQNVDCGRLIKCTVAQVSTTTPTDIINLSATFNCLPVTSECI